MEFVSENEGILSAYAADEIDRSFSLVHVVSPQSDQQSLQEPLFLDQGACSPASLSPEGSRNIDQRKLANLGPPNTLILDPNLPTHLRETDRYRHRAIAQVDQKRREKSPELKFQTFQGVPKFDAFRPLPRPHFSSDAMSVWPLRSIEESRLLQHFIQNLASWVCSCTALIDPTMLILCAVRRWRQQEALHQDCAEHGCL